MIIGITGLQSSGKDSIGDVLVKYYGFEKLSFATHLKDVCALLFGFDRKMLAGETPEDRAKRELPDEFWSKKMGKDFTPRFALQYFGTNLLRNQLHQNIWVDCLERKLESMNKNVVITDVRFPNEIDMIKNIGGHIWRVERGKLPDWFRKVESFQINGTENLMYDIPYYVPEIKTVHESEWKWVGYDKPETVFSNNGTLKDLGQSVIDYMQIEYDEL